MKYVFYELDSGRPISRKILRDDLDASIHNLYPRSSTPEDWRPFYDVYTTIAIVRDPIKRFLSAYSSRILQHSVLKRPRVRRKLRRRHLSDMPSLSEFVDRFREYRKASEIVKQHTIPQSRYIGENWDKISVRLPIEKVGEIPAILEKVTGLNLVLPNEQRSRQKLSASDLTPKQFDKLVDFYQDDYALLSEFYSPEKLLRPKEPAA